MSDNKKSPQVAGTTSEDIKLTINFLKQVTKDSQELILELNQRIKSLTVDY